MKDDLALRVLEEVVADLVPRIDHSLLKQILKLEAAYAFDPESDRPLRDIENLVETYLRAGEQR